jgi:CO/xanthine dehydrogenase FAD-binding subunit
MVALNATFGIASLSERRTVSASDFFTGLFSTALRYGELLTDIRIPAAPKRSGFAFLEISRRHGDFALVGVAAAVELDEREHCGVAGHGRRARGSCPTVDAITAAAEAATRTSIRPAIFTPRRRGRQLGC